MVLLRRWLRAKIHFVRLTGKDLNYKGSITIGEELLKASGIEENEMVHVVNVENGNRFETYVIKGNGKVVELNGAAARLGEVGDKLIIMAETLAEKKVPCRVVVCGEENEVVRIENN